MPVSFRFFFVLLQLGLSVDGFVETHNNARRESCKIGMVILKQSIDKKAVPFRMAASRNIFQEKQQRMNMHNDNNDNYDEYATTDSEAAAANAGRRRMKKMTVNEEMANTAPLDRRSWMAAAVSTLILAAPSVTNAYEKAYPIELGSEDNGANLATRDRRMYMIRQKEAKQRDDSPLAPSKNPLDVPIGGVLWGSALWFLSGSRSNPLVTPIANVIYDEKEEQWLKDRNEGLFADLPLLLFAVMAVVFVALGIGTDTFITAIADGDSNISFQLAGVCLIGGGSLELGRISSGEKKQTRAETARDTQLVQEFEEFALKRLKPGGNIHRNEVVQAFRRYFAKYRQADNPEYPLTDLEVEQLLRSWGRRRGLEMSSAGFYNGLQINRDADLVAGR